MLSYFLQGSKLNSMGATSAALANVQRSKLNFFQGSKLIFIKIEFNYIYKSYRSIRALSIAVSAFKIGRLGNEISGVKNTMFKP